MLHIKSFSSTPLNSRKHLYFVSVYFFWCNYLVVVRLEPSKLLGKVGDRVSVSVKVYGVSNLYSYDVHLTWNPKVLRLVDFAFGPFLTPSDPTKIERYQAVFDDKLSLGARLISPESPKSGDGVLALATWEVLSSTYTSISLDSNLLDPDANPIVHEKYGAEFGTKIDVTAVASAIAPMFAVALLPAIFKPVIETVRRGV